MNDDWPKWQGHAVDGRFPLQRYLGCSDHSGVFLTQAHDPDRGALAIKLVPIRNAAAALVESQLARWREAVGFAHPHLVTLREVGRCRLGELPCLYCLMEYADQTLAQLLLQRALTENEAREILPPTLAALRFLHGQGLAHGRLKPANFLAVGERLKLSSDSLRPVDVPTPDIGVPGTPDVPRGANTVTAADDIRALGLTLLEALTRTAPGAAGGRDAAVALPGDLSPSFRAIIARCLSHRPEDRPDLAELDAWVNGAAPRTATVERPVDVSRPAKPAAAGTSAHAGVREVAPAIAAGHGPRERRSLVPTVSAVAAVLVLAAVGARMLMRHGSPPAPAPSTVEAPRRPEVRTSSAPETGVQARAAGSGVDIGTAARSSVQASPPAQLHQEIPDVPLSARETIQGRIKVWVRVAVDPRGKVFDVHADRPGPSRYFERLAMDAAGKWTFPPSDAGAPRQMQLRFEFGRSGTTARAVTPK